MNKKKILHMGADIWARIFPDSFYKSFAFDSYSSLDLDSVDRSVTKTLNQYIDDDSWDLMICINLYFLYEYYI